MTTAGPGREPDDYVIGHIRDALAHDPRTTELGVDVTLAGDRVVLTGTVASVPHRDEIGRVASEVARGYAVVNDVDVVACDEATDAEELA